MARAFVLSRSGMVVGILLLAACARIPPPPGMLEQSLPHAPVPARWAAADLPGPVSGNWLAGLDDPAVARIVEEALTYNADLRQAAAQVVVAREVVVVVAARMLPQIGAELGGASTRDQDQDSNFDSTRGYLGLAWEIDLWGRLSEQRAAAEAGYQATALDYAWARQSLAATTAQAWYQAVEAHALLALSRESAGIYAKLLELAQTRRKAGKTGDLDVEQAAANLNNAASLEREAEAVYGMARRNLEVLLGRYPAAEIGIANAFSPLAPLPGASAPGALLARRPDVKAAEQRVISAFHVEQSARLALLPSLSLSLLGGRLSDQVLSVLRLNPWLTHGEVGLSVPIYTGGALEAQVRIADARQQAAVAYYGSTVLTAFREVENALGNDTLMAQRAVFERTAVAQRTAAVATLSRRYHSGASGLAPVLAMQSVELANRANLVKLEGARRANRIRLLLALGGGIGGESPQEPVENASLGPKP